MTDLASVWKGLADHRGKVIVKLRDVLINITDHIVEEGDRTYFGSTNHADRLKEVVLQMDSAAWDYTLKKVPEIDPYQRIKELEEENKKLNRRIQFLQTAEQNHISDLLRIRKIARNRLDKLREYKAELRKYREKNDG